MAKLTAAARKNIPTKLFGLPEKAPGSGSYPLEDKSHALAAERLMHHASPADQKKIKSKIHRLYPGLAKGVDPSKTCGLSAMCA
jgi:hypothetical protein